MLIAAFVVGALLGGLAAWLVLRERVRARGLAREAAEQMEGTIDRATANLPDPSYPKR